MRSQKQSAFRARARRLGYALDLSLRFGQET
jgi:hypothetical protein